MCFSRIVFQWLEYPCANRSDLYRCTASNPKLRPSKTAFQAANHRDNFQIPITNLIQRSEHTKTEQRPSSTTRSSTLSTFISPHPAHTQHTPLSPSPRNGNSTSPIPQARPRRRRQLPIPHRASPPHRRKLPNASLHSLSLHPSPLPHHHIRTFLPYRFTFPIGSPYISQH